MKKLLFLNLLVLSILTGYSQSAPVFRAGELTQSVVGYNFFTGADAKNFETTPQRLGSGVFDFSGQYNLFNFWLMSPNKYPVGISTGVGLKIAKFRFVNKYYFDVDTNILLIDAEKSHVYNNNFFSRHGSKLVTGKVYVPLLIYLPVHKWFNNKKDDFGIFAGAFYERHLFAYHKLIFKEKSNLQKVVNKGYGVGKFLRKHGVGVRAGIKIKNILIFGQHTLTPFFSDLLPYKVNETRVGINFYLNYQKYIDGFDKKDKSSKPEFGTDV